MRKIKTKKSLILFNYLVGRALYKQHQPIANPNLSCGWINNFELWFLPSIKYLQSTVVISGNFIIPPLHKALLVGYNTMRSFILILTVILTLPLLSYQQKVDKTNDLKNEKYLNFLAAVQNISTFSYFTVIKVKNLNSGVTKEICTKGNFVSGALHIELKISYDTKGEQRVLEIFKSKKNRYFEFKNKKALDNISFFEYKTNLVTKIQNKYSFDQTIEIIKKYKHFSIPLSDDEMKAFAHVLFNMGYMTGENNCWGGRLEYVDRTKDIFNHINRL